MLQRLHELWKVARDVLDNWTWVKAELRRHNCELDLVFSPSGVGSWKQYDQAALHEMPGRSVEINEGRTFAEERALIRSR
jgi:hypothetical protein